MSGGVCNVFPTSIGPFDAYSPITIQWNDCSTSAVSYVDLYLNVEQSAGLVPVHVWTGIDFRTQTLSTQLKATWWNATNGVAETVTGRFIMVQQGGQVWASSFPASNPFSIAFNGSMPSNSLDAFPAAYTGPSVESVGGSKPAISGAKLGLIIIVPILVVGAAVAIYVTWQRRKRAPEKKRWSAVIDNRMSMISAGTAPPPRFSMHSYHSSNPPSLEQQRSRPSMAHSIRSQTNSVYSNMQTPPAPGSIRLGSSPRLSFAEAPTRPSYERKQSSLRNSLIATAADSPQKTTRMSNARHSVAGILTSVVPSPGPAVPATVDDGRKVFAGAGHASSWSTSVLPRSLSTQEQLASPRQRSSPSKLRNSTMLSTAMMAEQQRNQQQLAMNRISTMSAAGNLEDMTAVKIVRDPSLAYELAKSASSSSSTSNQTDEKNDSFESFDEKAGPFADPIEDEARDRATLAEMQQRYAASNDDLQHMRMASATSMTPDDALQRYAAAIAAPASPQQQPSQENTRFSRFKGMIRSFSRTMSPSQSGHSVSIENYQTPPMSPVSVSPKLEPATSDKALPRFPTSSTLARLAEEEERQLEKQRKALSAMSFAASPPSSGRRQSQYDDEARHPHNKVGKDEFGMAM